MVKISGFRIELEEIENTLVAFKGIRDVAVIVKEYMNDEKYICTYFTSDISLEEQDIRAFLSSKLPYYMVPKYIIRLEKMPLNTSGKIDKKILSEVSQITQKPKSII
jgi:fengycin family lipopeptide synthetase D